MSYQINSECKRCGLCQTACPAGAVVKIDEAYVIVAERCRSCGACAVRCPRGAITISQGPRDFELRGTRPEPLERGDPFHRLGDHCRAHFHHACRGHGGRRHPPHGRHGRRDRNGFLNWIGRLLWPAGERQRKPGSRTGEERHLDRREGRRVMPEYRLGNPAPGSNMYLPAPPGGPGRPIP